MPIIIDSRAAPPDSDRPAIVALSGAMIATWPRLCSKRPTTAGAYEFVVSARP